MTELPTNLPRTTQGQSSAGRPVTAYLKPSDYCNVGCDHCYLPLVVRANKTRMSSDTLEAAIAAIRKMILHQRASGVLIVWHGGEPLSLPKEYFRDACDRVRELMPDAIQSIQTSLIPYSSSWADMLHTYMDGHIGSSIDFSQRTIRGDVGRYHDLWLTKVAAARADGFSITPGVVPSRGEMSKGHEINRWMIERGFYSWNIDRYNSFGGDDPNRPSNAEHSQFLTEVFDSVMQEFISGKCVRVNTVQAALMGVAYNRPGDRWGGSCSRDFIVVNPDGSTSACPDKISFENFSNINDGYDEFAKSEMRKAWIREHISGHRNSYCSTCAFNSFCRSGCPLTPNAPESEGECSGYHRHLTHVSKFVQSNPGVVEAYLSEISK